MIRTSWLSTYFMHPNGLNCNPAITHAICIIYPGVFMQEVFRVLDLDNYTLQYMLYMIANPKKVIE
jgi:hypothetical protein